MIQHEDVKRIFDELTGECRRILETKGPDYAGDDGDAMYNFKEAARRAAISPFQAWVNHFSKHMIAVENAIVESPHNPRVKSETIRSRMADFINYSVLLLALIEDAEEAHSQQIAMKMNVRG